MIQLASPPSPANSTQLHLAVACIKPEQLPVWTSPPNGASPRPVLNTGVLPLGMTYPVAEGYSLPGSSSGPTPTPT